MRSCFKTLKKNSQMCHKQGHRHVYHWQTLLNKILMFDNYKSIIIILYKSDLHTCLAWNSHGINDIFAYLVFTLAFICILNATGLVFCNYLHVELQSVFFCLLICILYISSELLSSSYLHTKLQVVLLCIYLYTKSWLVFLANVRIKNCNWFSMYLFVH